MNTFTLLTGQLVSLGLAACMYILTLKLFSK